MTTYQVTVTRDDDVWVGPPGQPYRDICKEHGQVTRQV